MVAASGLVHSTPRIAIQDFRVGLPAMLICLEMAVFAIMHYFSYSWKPYRVPSGEHESYYGGTFGIKAILDALNLWDIVKELARSWKWVLMGRERNIPERNEKGI